MALTFQQFLFYAFGAVLVGAALGVITARNPVHSVLYLVLAFFTSAAIWLLLEAEFLAISPNAKIPAIVDHDPADGAAPVPVFESGAILLYLAEKTGRFLPTELRGRKEVLEWLFWQVGGLGPMLGQHGHFALYAPERIPYAVERYRAEALRLYGVLDRRLAGREHLCGAYSIADMACWPWVLTYRSQGIDLGAFPNVRRWYDGGGPARREGG